MKIPMFNPLTRRTIWLVLLVLWTGCSTGVQTRVSGKLSDLSKNQTIAILPVKYQEAEQREAASLFRRSLYANLKQARFEVMERYVVDSLLKQKGLTDPSKYDEISPMEWGEILGADAVIFSQIDNMKRYYFVVHSSIEIAASTKMLDTRSGEVLWMAQQTEKEFSGIMKIPTGMIAAGVAPIQFVTNKLNLYEMTQNLAEKLTAAVKRPEVAKDDIRFKERVIASSATEDLKRLRDAQVTVEGGVYHKQPPQNVALPLTPQVETVLKPKPAKPQAVLNLPNAQLVPLTPPTPTIFFTLQVGAYKTKAYAQKMLRALRDKGHEVFLSLFRKKGDTFYRVQVDRFQSREEALAVSKDLAEREQLDNFVTRLEPSN